MKPGKAMRWVYQLHVWTGVSAGLVLLLLCVSGTIAVFRYDLVEIAGRDVLRTDSSCELGADEALDRLRASLSGDDSIRRLSLPSLTGGYYELRMADGRRRSIEPCGRIVPTHHAELGTYLVNLHTRIFLGKAGRWVVGSLGLLMLLSALSGVLVHRKLFAQFFTLRWGRSRRLLLSDGHKLIAVWLLPFHLLIAASGAWLGLYPLFETEQAGQGKAVGAVKPEAPTRSAMQLDALLASSRQQIPGLEPVFIDFLRHERSLTVSIRGNLPGQFVQRHRTGASYDVRSGELLSIDDLRTEGMGARVFYSIMPLHVGDWSGAAIKWLYFVLGLGSSVLIWLGLKLWADRRERSRGLLLPAGSSASRVLNAVTVGMLVASLLPVMAHLFGYPYAPSGSEFLLLWVLASTGAGLANLGWRLRQKKGVQGRAIDPARP